MAATPRIDNRDTETLVAQTEALAVAYTRPQPGDPVELRSWAPATDGARDLGSTLIQLFSRMVSQVIDRINEVPEKNHLAYLNLLGASRLPPRAARAPVTFKPTAETRRELVVPAGTRVGAKADGPLPEAIFETELDLVLSHAQLSAVYVVEPAEDRYSDRTDAANGLAAGGYPAFVGDRPVDHAIYLACDPLFALPGVQSLSITLTSKTLVAWNELPLSGSWWDGTGWQTLDRAPSWEKWTGERWEGRADHQRLTGLEVRCPGDDDTGDLLADQIRVTAGSAFDAYERESVLHEPRIVDLSETALALEAAGIDARIVLVMLAYHDPEPQLELISEADAAAYAQETWLRLARLQVTRTGLGGNVSHAIERTVTDHVLTVTVLTPPQPAPSTIAGITACWLRAHFTGLLPLDPAQRPWMPTGVTIQASVDVKRAGLPVETAFTGSTLIDLSKDFTPFGLRPAFNDSFYLASREVFSRPGAQVTLHVVLSEEQATALPSSDLKIAFEAWNGRTWIEVGRTSPTGPRAPSGASEPATGFTDETLALTVSGAITLVMPARVEMLEVEGRENYWLRVRVLSGTYGSAAYYDATSAAWVDAVVQPPWLKLLELDYAATLTGDLQGCVTDDGGEQVDRTAVAVQGGAGFTPFQPVPDTEPALYLGFDRALENRAISLFLASHPPLPHEVATKELETGQLPSSPGITWEYVGAHGWTALQAEDETRELTGSGLLRFIGPVGAQASSTLGRRLWWLRARWDRGMFRAQPRLGRILTNTTWAGHAVSHLLEVLGSSTAVPDQVFKLSQTPVLLGEQIEVLESEAPSPEELMDLGPPDGAPPVHPPEDGQPSQVWVRWRSMPDFYGSTGTDRHYVLDPETGEVRFGNGERGRIPPAGTENIRAARYQSGGGSHGDRAVGAISQLKSALPYIESVTNHVASTGGSDLETIERVKGRTARNIRHRGRAVTVQDYEDLALDASTEVARARAIPPMFDPIELNDGPLPDRARGVGTVLVVIVPDSTDRTPTPGMELIRQVEEQLISRSAPATRFRVAGPRWADVHIQARLSPLTPELGHVVINRARELLEAWLHPLTGNMDGGGWPFSRRPYESDIYRLLSRIEGLDHIESVHIDCPLIPEDLNVLYDDERRALPWTLICSGTHTLELAAAAREG